MNLSCLACVAVTAMSLAEEIVEKVCTSSMGPDSPLDDTADVGQFEDGIPAGFDPSDDPDLLGAVADDDLDEVNDNLSEFVDDNVSLEVNFGDGGSCRASDVSSLSFQNIVLDNPETVQYQESIGIRYRRDSLSESSTSPLNEFADSTGFDSRLEDDLEPRPMLSPGYDNVDTGTGSEDEINTGTMKRRTKMTCQPDSKNCGDDMCPTNNGGGGCSGGGMCSGTNSTNSYTACNDGPSHHPLQENGSRKSSERDTASGQQVAGHQQHPLVSMSGNVSDGDFSKTDLLLRSPDEEVASTETTLKKRNSLEIRNNIPNVNVVKNYGETGAVAALVSSNMLVHTTMPKMKKKSPGLARRLPDSVAEFMDRDSSSSERDDQPLDVSVISAQKCFDQQCQNGTEHAGNVPPLVSLDEMDSRNNAGDLDQVCLDLALLEQSIDVENEYDYVKYARIQQGSSYVGMRLAYSNNSVNHPEAASEQAGYPLDMSRETSPAKQTRQLTAPPSNGLGAIAGMLNEDLLTEISLTGSSDQAHSDEHKQFTLSPEATECDSAEVESVISEEGKSSSLNGMPAVEDGLSSSQASDGEEPMAHDGMPQPADILKQRCKADIDLHQQMADGNGPPSPYHEETFGRRRRALDSAIRDIQSAIERSKTVQPEGASQHPEVVEDDPVWVKR